MGESQTQAVLRQRLIAAAVADLRIVGLVNDGSTSTGRGDVWSDLDVSVFIRDADFESFTRDWEVWAKQFGDLLLAYISYVGHPWTVYAAEPVPLRVDFDFHRESTLERVAQWPASPLSIEAMLWYDGTGGRLRASVAHLVGKSLRPSDLHAAFVQHCGDLWYALLYTFSKLQRGQHWVARQAFHRRVLEPLLHLLRLEAGAIDRWQAQPAGLDVEQTLAPNRLLQVAACIPAPDAMGVANALGRVATLGYEVCEAIGRRSEWSWPHVLAEQTVHLFGNPDPF